MESPFYHRSTCRLCYSPEVELALKLAPCPPVDAFVPQSKIAETQEAFPMDLYLCNTCGHAQLLDVVSPNLLFGSYIYTTSSSPGLIEYFREYAKNVINFLSPEEGDLALDIGSNDGTLLRFLKEAGFKTLGVDPAADIAAAATREGIETIPAFFSNSLATELRERFGPIKLITANNVFAHSDTLGDMADGVQTLLAEDGVFIFEVSYLLDMVQNMIFDFIYHEHLSHHSVKPLKRFLTKHGLHLFHVERTASKGGSIRCFAQKISGPKAESQSVGDLLALEETAELYRPNTYKQFAARIQTQKDALLLQLSEVHQSGRSIAAYGASATGTVLLHHFDIGRFIDYIVDDNPDRQGRYSPGHHIPVVSRNALLNNPPDYVLILAWRFAPMIVDRNQDYRERGGRFIIPLPHLEIR